MTNEMVSEDPVQIADNLYGRSLGSPEFIRTSGNKFTLMTEQFFLNPLQALMFIGYLDANERSPLLTLTGNTRASRTPFSGDTIERMFNNLTVDLESPTTDEVARELINITLRNASLPWPAMATPSKSKPYVPRYASSDGLSGILRFLANLGTRHSFLIALVEFLREIPSYHSDFIESLDHELKMSGTREESRKWDEFLLDTHRGAMDEISYLLMEIISESQLTKESFALFKSRAYKLMDAAQSNADKLFIPVLEELFSRVRDEVEAQEVLLVMGSDDR